MVAVGGVLLVDVLLLIKGCWNAVEVDVLLLIKACWNALGETEMQLKDTMLVGWQINVKLPLPYFCIFDFYIEWCM